jgi:hypothetical protein
MDFKQDRCPKCGKHNIIISSNNPLTPSVCNYCITSLLNYNSLEHGDFFCRSYNIPFKPDLWIKLSNIHKQDVFKEYVAEVSETLTESLYYNKPTTDLWKKGDEEWKLVQTHEELMERIQPIKEGFVLRNKIKWGSDYTFQELISLEHLFMNTLRSNDISNPMQIDAIKKACKMSIALDRAITSGESKEINDLSKAYQNFVKTAKIDDIITAASQDVISNVAELVDFLEKNGFEFTYYDDVERDIVDKSINDIKQYIKRLVLDASGAHLETVFDSISNALNIEKATKANAESYEKVPLEELLSNETAKRNEQFDADLESEGQIMDEDFEDDEDENFGD